MIHDMMIQFWLSFCEFLFPLSAFFEALVALQKLARKGQITTKDSWETRKKQQVQLGTAAYTS